MIVVALSGGVDSATAAGLLLEAGHDVVAVSMRLYDARGTTASVGGRCCGPRDLEDARRVAAHLGIPFYVADYEEDFQRHVIDDFVEAYRHGRTPNPCVRCNQHVKFTPLLKRARALGATALATGHYARLVPDSTDGTQLWRGVDDKKDQSYFLFHMPKAALGFVQFPLGGLTKDEVRAHARRLGLPNQDKAESQEICFVPDGDYAGFVERAAPDAAIAGDVVDEAGKVLGGHAGIHRFTVGQRRGIRVPGLDARYVVRVEADARRVVVGGAEALGSASLELDEMTWLGPMPSGPLRAGVQVRYRHAPAAATITATTEHTARVVFDTPERAPAPGQAAVIYDGDRVLGGGFIR